MVLALVLGSVHAFSVFLEPMEQLYAASRAAVSATYSFALVALTIAVLFGHRVYTLVSAPLFATALLALAAGGAAIAAYTTALWGVWLGYGLLFGSANGLGYGFALQASAQANPHRSGVAMGLVTAAYALGAFVSPVLFDTAIAAGGVPWGMLTLAAGLVATIPVAAALLRLSGFAFQVDQAPADISAATTGSRTIVLWIGYGAAVAAGLMAIGHATGIARAAGLDGSYVLAAPMCIAIANMIGAYVGGRLIDEIDARPVLVLLPLTSAAVLFALSASGGGAASLAGLAVVGFCYGAIIAAYPAAIAAMHGTLAGIRIYGRVFTAWGTAGLVAPWFAGVMFDASGDYGISLAVAGSLGVISGAVIYFMLSRNAVRSSIT